jgi:DNA-binding GntR family transcriptional regulator
MALAPLRKKRATDEVYDSLRSAILSRLFLPGERLLADELCQQLDVSLTPVRHALQQLAVEGLVEIHPRSGTYVASMSEEDLLETFEIRLALELLAGKRAIHRWNDAASQEFKRLLKGLALPVTSDETLKQHEALNREFHFKLFELAGSRKLSELYQSLHAHIQIARIHATEESNLPQLAARLEQEQIEHEAIVAALEEGSMPRIEEALRAHIQRAQESLRAALEARDAQLAADEPTKNGKRKRV